MSKPKAWVKYDEIEKSVGRFQISPLNRGMGNTIGNAIRRVLLSSLSGAAVTSVKVDGVAHEFSTIPNVVEDVLEIICNIKGIIFKLDGDEPVVVTLEVKGAKKVAAADIKCSDGVQILNKKHYIAEVSDKGKLVIEMTVEKGIGYQPARMVTSEDTDVSFISIDASFSPIIKVNHSVESIRIGKELDHDHLTLDVYTNGAVSPEDAVKAAVGILRDKLSVFDSINTKPESESDNVEDVSDQLGQDVLNMSIDDLELSARSSNCLKRAGIETVGLLVSKDMSELIQIKNFGKKSADEINGKLSQFNLELKS